MALKDYKCLRLVKHSQPATNYQSFLCCCPFTSCFEQSEQTTSNPLAGSSKLPAEPCPQTHLCSGCSVRLQVEFDPMRPFPFLHAVGLFEGWVPTVRCSGVVTSLTLPSLLLCAPQINGSLGHYFESIGAVSVSGET